MNSLWVDPAVPAEPECFIRVDMKSCWKTTGVRFLLNRPAGGSNTLQPRPGYFPSRSKKMFLNISWKLQDISKKAKHNLPSTVGEKQLLSAWKKNPGLFLLHISCLFPPPAECDTFIMQWENWQQLWSHVYNIYVLQRSQPKLKQGCAAPSRNTTLIH